MLDKDKLMLICYFGIKSYQDSSPFRINQIMAGFGQKLVNSFDESVKAFVIPQRTTDKISFEILNIKDCPQEKLDEIEKIYKQLLKDVKKEL